MHQGKRLIEGGLSYKDRMSKKYSSIFDDDKKDDLYNTIS